MRSDDEQREVDAMRRAHRIASERLEDGPDASVRAAVLAAAARAADARPQLASTQTPPSMATPPAPFRSRRWPLSAAALLVVSILTGLIATQVMRDSPERITAVASSTTAPRTAQTAVPDPGNGTTTETARPAPSAAEVQAERPSRVVESPRPKTDDHETRRPERSGGRSIVTAPVTPDRRPTQPQAPATSAFVGPPPAPAPSMRMARDTRSLATPSARSQAAAPSPGSADAQDATPGMNAPRAETEGFSRTTTAQNTARARMGRIAEPATPEAWVERIVKLRADGNDIEADRELDALRQRYPGFEIPAAALKTSGTR